MSQDIHTPRVIASPFLSKKRLRAILKPSARRWPETLPMMDEVDGRPGPVALQFGHLDALKRVPTASLSLPLKFTVILPQTDGCPILATPLLLSQGWDTASLIHTVWPCPDWSRNFRRIR